MNGFSRQDPHSRSIRPIVGRILLILLPIFLALLFYVWSRYETTHLAYTMTELSRQERLLVDEKRGLSLEVSRLGALERIETLARNKLGLTQPRAEQIVYVNGSAP